MSNNKTVATESSSLVEFCTIVPVQVEMEALNHDEQSDRHQLELEVEQGFYQAGKALAEIRERRLYGSTHKTFEAYCQDRFRFTRRYSDYLIAGTVVIENLQQTRTIHSQILPTKLEQVKPLTSLDPDEQRQVWGKAIEIANGKVPSGHIVKKTLKQLKETSLVLPEDYCQVGDVFTLVRLEGKEKKYNGCWAIAVELSDSTVIVEVHDATLTVKPENLNKVDSPKAHQQLPQILQRIRRLREVDSLDRGAGNILEDIGKYTHLTPVEEDLLSWLEKYYGVDT